VHTCLRHQMNFLSDACRTEEAKLAGAQQRDIRLRPKLAQVGGGMKAGAGQHAAARAGLVQPGRAAGPAGNALAVSSGSAARPPTRALALMSRAAPLPQACSNERVAFCRDVPPGRGRVIRCLVDNMDNPRFGAECKQQVRPRGGLLRVCLWGAALERRRVAAAASPVWG
jgi:hypothetical protein